VNLFTRAVSFVAPLAILALAVPAAARAAATPAPDPAMLALAKSTLAQLQAGKLDRSILAPATNRALPA